MKYVANGVLAGARNVRRCAMRRVSAPMTGQNAGLPDRPSPITSPHVPFFCVVKVSATNVMRDKSSRGMSVERNHWCPIQHCTSCKLKGVMSEAVPVSTGRRTRDKSYRQLLGCRLWQMDALLKPQRAAEFLVQE
jgi:hypothetical protein